MPQNDWTVIRQIGNNQGCFNEGVNLVKHRSNGMEAIEKLFKKKDIKDGHARWEREALAQLKNHPHITNMLDYDSRKGTVYLEYYPYGTLDSLIKRHAAKQQTFHELFILETLYHLAEALHYCHYGSNPVNPIVHRDIKPGNVFLRPPQGREVPFPQPVLGDFGCCITMAHAHENMERVNVSRCTPNFASPEAREEGAYLRKGDVFALGKTILCMCLLKPAVSPTTKDPGPQYSKGLTKILACMVHENKFKRVTAKEVMDMVKPVLDAQLAKRGSSRLREIGREIDVARGRE